MGTCRSRSYRVCSFRPPLPLCGVDHAKRPRSRYMVEESPAKKPLTLNLAPIDQIIESHDDNEVVSHESREDVINVILGSEEVMEGHVFPYLNGLLGE